MPPFPRNDYTEILQVSFTACCAVASLLRCNLSTEKLYSGHVHLRYEAHENPYYRLSEHLFCHRAHYSSLGAPGLVCTTKLGIEQQSHKCALRVIPLTVRHGDDDRWTRSGEYRHYCDLVLTNRLHGQQEAVCWQQVDTKGRPWYFKRCNEPKDFLKTPGIMTGRGNLTTQEMHLGQMNKDIILLQRSFNEQKYIQSVKVKPLPCWFNFGPIFIYIFF